MECPGAGVPEGWGNPSVAQITADLTYIATNLASNPSYLRIDGKFVVFVYGAKSAILVPWQLGHVNAAALRLLT